MLKQEVQKVWNKYLKYHDLTSKNKLIEHYYPLVISIAGKLSRKYNNKITRDDLTSYGLDGLYRAILAYDKTRKNKFETYAYRRIWGSMIDHLRSNDWVPRSVRIRHNKMEETKSVLEMRNGYKATEKEIVNEIGIDETKYCKNRKKYHISIQSSLENCFSDIDRSEHSKDCNKSMEDTKHDAPDANLAKREFVNKILNYNMEQVEKEIIYYYYYERLQMKEISKKVNMSASRVSQAHRGVLKKLKEYVQNDCSHKYKNIISEYI